MLLLARNWWVFLLRGILALVFGVAAVFFPEAAFLSLVLVFGAFALVDGIFSIIAAVTGTVKTENWWWLLLEGIFGILIGLLTLVQPAAMGRAWIFVIASWAVVTGILEIFTAVKLRKVIEREFWMILSGMFSVVFGVLAFTYPQSGAFAIGLITGIYAVMFGITMLMFAFRLRKHKAAHASA
jgi:uncharacterized membrane protein HdeD (DUF308 family)